MNTYLAKGTPRRATGGAAAIELALMAPIFAVLLIAIVDFAFAFYSKQQLATAVSTAMQFAYNNGQNVSAAQVPTFLANVATVAKTATSLSLATPTVKFNNASDGSNANSCYCIDGPSGTWTTATCGTSCSTNGPTAGKYVSIVASYSYTPIIRSDFLAAGTVSDSILVRVQ